MKKRRTRVNKETLEKFSTPVVKLKEPKSEPSKPTDTIGIINRGMIHEKILARQLGGAVIPYNRRGMRRYDAFIYLGPFVSSRLRLLRWASKRFRDVKIYIWWIGTDVYNAMNGKYGFNMLHITSIKNVTHLAVSKNLKDELSALGINATVLTLVPNADGLEPLPLPEEYTVAVYMPSQSLDFYKYDLVKEVIERTPDTNYIIYGNKDRLDVEDYENVEGIGWVDDTRVVFEKANCLFRLVEHDGFPKSIIESVNMGRYVITNFDYPMIDAVNGVDDIVDKINSRPVLGDDVVAWYKENLTMQKIVDYFWGE